MLKSEQRYDAPLSAQEDFWNRWNAETREAQVGLVSIEQASVISTWLEGIGRHHLNIIDVGCGTGWLCERLTQYGKVTGTDLAGEVLARASQRLPEVQFVPGNFMALDFGSEQFDVATSVEVISHVADQSAFLSKIADILKPGGYLILASQNRPALERNDIPPPGAGQVRHWLDRHELSKLMNERFDIQELRSITPLFNRGYMRYLNSRKLSSALARIGLGVVTRLSKDCQERAWLGWTLMALGKRRV